MIAGEEREDNTKEPQKEQESEITKISKIVTNQLQFLLSSVENHI